MKLPVSTYVNGSVVDVEYPFREGDGRTKLRPAIVMSYDSEMTYVALLQVTTHAPRSKYDYTIKEYSGTGLPHDPSVVRCDCVYVIPNTELLQRKGVLSRDDLNAVTYLFKQAISEKKVQYYSKNKA